MAFLHIEFKDGSNPWLTYGKPEKIKHELYKWKRNYYVTILDSLADGSLMVLAENKIEADRAALRNLFLGEEIPLF